VHLVCFVLFFDLSSSVLVHPMHGCASGCASPYAWFDAWAEAWDDAWADTRLCFLRCIGGYMVMHQVDAFADAWLCTRLCFLRCMVLHQVVLLEVFHYILLCS
jgi:hypothetical protein